MGAGSSKESYEMKRLDQNQAEILGTNLSQAFELKKQTSKVIPIVELANTPDQPEKLRRSSSALAKPERSASVGNLKRQRTMSSMVPNSSSKNAIQVSSKIPWLVKKIDGNSKIDEATFTPGVVLGKGLMGTVYVASFVNSNPRLYVAIKSIRKDYIARHNDDRHVQNEKEVLQLHRSPFCVKLFATYQDVHHIHFVLEYCAGGELFRRLTKKSAFTPNTAKFYICEVYLALAHIQDLGFVYRDLKPENIMLDEFGHCKLIDFGFTTRPNAQGMCTTNVGTPAYLSPEQLNGKFTNGYTKVVDWWSFGILLYELLTGKTPFCKNFKESNYEIYLRILGGKIKFPRSFSPSAKLFVSSLLNFNLTERLVDPVLIKQSTYFDAVDWEGVAGKHIIPPFIPKLEAEGDSRHFDDYGEVGLCGSVPVKMKKGMTSDSFTGF
jgi:serine/threonine protein kinase